MVAVEPIVKIPAEDMFSLERYVFENRGVVTPEQIPYFAGQMVVAACEGDFDELEKSFAVSMVVRLAFELMRSSYEMTSREIANLGFTSMMNWVRGELQ